MQWLDRLGKEDRLGKKQDLGEDAYKLMLKDKEGQVVRLTQELDRLRMTYKKERALMVGAFYSANLRRVSSA